MSNLPHWDLSNVYPALSSAEFIAGEASIRNQLEQADALLTKAGSSEPANAAELATTLGGLVDALNDLIRAMLTHGSYINAFITTDSRDAAARRKLSEFEQVQVRYEQVYTRFRAWVGSLGDALEKSLHLNQMVERHAFILREIAEQARYMMSEAEESLASEMSLSGGNSLGKLQGTVTSQLSVPFELYGETKSLPMPALINLRTHPDESVRRSAYEAENAAWDSVREPLAAAINGVKGEAVTLNRKRGRTDALHAPLDGARMDRATLNAMLDAMRDSFPMWQRYFLAKAKRLGKEKLAWWDILAPVGKTETNYTWEETRAFILQNFATFSPDLAAYAQRAFDENWIDAEPRTGKRGGAFCMGVPGIKESRILTNFDGSLDQISTVAHELGHGWHNECIYQSGKTMLLSRTPMTLAETASIMCETIAMQAVLEKATSAQEELGILENLLSGQAQVIVDIYSRFLFEQELFTRREQSEVSADELCDMMARAQTATYGDALDEQYLQKYMWTWKPHYYSARLSFYNFPYAFGLLFATGLYAIYQERGAEFVPDYNALLASTGEAPAAELAARFSIDIRTRDFWDASLATIGKSIDRYCAI